MTEHFIPTRTAALEHLARFVPHAGSDYARLRNYDLGPGKHKHVSTLSPYLRHRLITEAEVLEAVLSRHSLRAAEKFVQEVFWRTYWKGWLEMRPGVWDDYLAQRDADWNAVQTQSGLRQQWTDACAGNTGLDTFDQWAQELVQTGYLHNHARMWMASIWIFTLRLPWTLGADFFLRHLLDGDPASNTLSWRWVAGLQTKGKTYLARASNIERYTRGRFDPTGLASEAPALNGPDHPARHAIAAPVPIQPGLRTGILLHPDDLSPGFVLEAAPDPVAVAAISHRNAQSHLATSPKVCDWEQSAIDDVITRWSGRLGPVEVIDDLAGWTNAHDLAQIVTAYAPVGPEADALQHLQSSLPDLRIIRVRRSYDSAAWLYATHGFFRFKDRIPALIGELKYVHAA